MAKNEKTARIATMPMFAGCDTKALKAMAVIADEVVVDAGATLITQGAQLRHVYVVESGIATVAIDGQAAGTVEPGQVLGELSMFDRAPAAATIVAMTEMRVFVIPFVQFEETVRANPDLAVAMMKTMAARFHSSNN
jgi:CRP-like cAMP-binding protein